MDRSAHASTQHSTGPTSNSEQLELKPTNLIDPKTAGGDHTVTALVVLNSPLEDAEYVRALWNHASYRICADGGANRLHDLVTSYYVKLDLQHALEKLRPDCIHGDLDSLRSHVRSRYENLGVEVSHDGDQYSTDFDKAVKKIIQNRPNTRELLVLGSLGGRVDQGLGLLSQIYHMQLNEYPNIRIWLCTSSSISMILRPGTSIIRTPMAAELLTGNIGILPIFGPASITTQGLEWDVADWRTLMGGNVSTSNHIKADTVTVKTDHDILLTLERKSADNESVAN